jgi:dienelactone hydrolase
MKWVLNPRESGSDFCGAWKAMYCNNLTLALSIGILLGTVSLCADEPSSELVNAAPTTLQSIFNYTTPRSPATSDLVEDRPLYQKYLVQFPSAMVTEYSDSETISAMYYTPTGRTKFPVIIMLPHISGGVAAQRYMTHGYLRAGFAVLHITSPYYFTFSKRHESWLAQAKDLDDLVEVVHLLRQAVINARQGIDWLVKQPGVDPDRIGLMGISMGGWVGVSVTGVDPRIKSAVYVLAGGDMTQLLTGSVLAASLRKHFAENNVAMDDVRVVTNVIDPISGAVAASSRPTLMINATFDGTVPRACADLLWKALGQPQIYWVPTGHTTSNLFRWYIRQKSVRHFLRTLQ